MVISKENKTLIRVQAALQFILGQWSCKYRKCYIRSRPFIILDPKFHRLVLEVLKKVQILEQNFFYFCDRGPLENPKNAKKYEFLFFTGVIVAYKVRPLIE